MLALTFVNTETNLMMEYIVKFFDSKFFIIVGGISTLLMFASLLYAAYLVLTGIAPVLYRLGTAL